MSSTTFRLKFTSKAFKKLISHQKPSKIKLENSEATMKWITYTYQQKTSYNFVKNSKNLKSSSAIGKSWKTSEKQENGVLFVIT